MNRYTRYLALVVLGNSFNLVATCLIIKTSTGGATCFLPNFIQPDEENRYVYMIQFVILILHFVCFLFLFLLISSANKSCLLVLIRSSFLFLTHAVVERV